MKLLICKDNINNKLIETRILYETDNIKYSIIEDAPEIEQREGYIGKYTLDEEGNIAIEYTEQPLSETEQLEQRMSEMQELISELVYGGMEE